MNLKDITDIRLVNQHLAENKFIRPEEVIGWFGAMQSQDFNAAKWSVGLRLKNASDKLIEDAYNDGLILRTHVMRPTWHFVLPEDINWMQKLTSANVKKLMGHYNKKLELTDHLFRKSETVITKSLRNKNYLTRQELKEILEKAGIKTDVQRLAHIVSWAELDCLICSGPMRGKSSDPEGPQTGGQFTYALVEERVKKLLKLNKKESLGKLVLSYFQSHGPALLKDFSWWSGLSVKDAAEGLSLTKSKLLHEVVDDKTYWFSDDNAPHNLLSSTFLLSVYDEYFISYKDRGLILKDYDREKMPGVGNALLTSLVIINGKVAGTWKRKLKKNKLEIKINLFRKLKSREIKSLDKFALQYGKFFEKETFVIYE